MAGIREEEKMSEVASIAAALFRHVPHGRRVLVAVAGAPGSGKSTLAAALAEALAAGGHSAAAVPMDGFHYDDAVLRRLDLASRKGAPETFDFAGLESLLARLKRGDSDVAIPLFDRSMELARAAAAIVPAGTKFVLVEGNYLLLDEAPWSRLRSLFDFAVFIDVPRDELERRLLRRWVDHGRADGPAWVASNDMPNVDRVLAKRLPADLVVQAEVPDAA
jgi:pantothenate kinase